MQCAIHVSGQYVPVRLSLDGLATLVTMIAMKTSSLRITVYKLCSTCGHKGHCAADCALADAIKAAIELSPESVRMAS